MKFSMHDTSLADEIEPFDRTGKAHYFEANSALGARHLERIDAAVSSFMKNIVDKQHSYREDIEAFDAYIATNPATGEYGTTSVGSLFWLFVIARNLNPSLIVESGVWFGSSLHCFRNACPAAQLYGFDLDFSRLKFADSAIHLVENDWSQSDIRANSSNDLCYFDDHINNALRIRQAYERGFRNLIFDDAATLGEVHKFRYPGLPTVPMLVEQELVDGDTLRWYHEPTEKYLEYRYAEEHTHGVKPLIDFACRIPNLEPLTSLPSGLQYFVRLKA
jgi:hypothetical protein